MPPRSVLAIDTASAVVSVAAAVGGGDREGAVDLALRTSPQRRSSPLLIGLVDEVLDEVDRALPDLDLLVAVRGPGSFTGIRVGLATAIGFHQALALPATAVSTLTALAALAGEVRDEDDRPGAVALAAVDARRGDWNVQRFEVGTGGAPQPLDEARRLPAEAVAELEVDLLVGFGVEPLAEMLGGDVRTVDPGPAPGGSGDLPAAAVARLALATPLEVDPALLTTPLYLRPPAVEPPGEPKSVLAEVD